MGAVDVPGGWLDRVGCVLDQGAGAGAGAGAGNGVERRG